MSSEPITITMLVVDLLESMGVRYAIGGSFASTLHGIARATMDSDLVVDLQESDIHQFIQGLNEAFYYDEQTIRNAIQRRPILHSKQASAVATAKCNAAAPIDHGVCVDRFLTGQGDRMTAATVKGDGAACGQGNVQGRFSAASRCAAAHTTATVCRFGP